MDIQRAKEILGVLAEGVDPTTGELLQRDSVYNQGDVVRALYTVLNHLKETENLPKQNKEPQCEEDYDRELYEQLKALRTEIAQAKGLKAFHVFPNAPLMEMAARIPTTTEEFLKISGVGAVKMEQYGKLFLTAIQGYLQERGKL